MKFLVNNEVSENLDIQKLLSKNLYKSMELINYKTLEEVAAKIKNAPEHVTLLVSVSHYIFVK